MGIIRVVICFSLGREIRLKIGYGASLSFGLEVSTTFGRGVACIGNIETRSNTLGDVASLIGEGIVDLTLRGVVCAIGIGYGTGSCL